MSLYLASVTLHLLAAIFSLGGMFFLGIVGAPALAGLDTPFPVPRTSPRGRPPPTISVR